MHPRDYAYTPKMDNRGWATLFEAQACLKRERETPWRRWRARTDLRQQRRRH
jgi:hypothetical protein